ncbi:TadE-like protein [Desulfoscipio geothermicus DSM 3669]|uniref:TadE-like protein n=1 Tax=Desulfoscipio geothermicus DSM 3669 TaxID=1121426 RepID=A0A1I6DNE7_9FIRM|nr:TadE-like protein [Desulfoscipio geothermicus DSM 3669]
MVLEFALIFPVILFFILGALTWGQVVIAKNAAQTAARETARTYAITHEKEEALAVTEHVLGRTLSNNKELYNVTLTDGVITNKALVPTDSGGTHCLANVSFKVPIAVPNLPKLINHDAEGWGNTITVTGSAVFKKEFEISEED